MSNSHPLTCVARNFLTDHLPSPALYSLRVTDASHHVASFGFKLIQDYKYMPPPLAGLSLRVISEPGLNLLRLELSIP